MSTRKAILRSITMWLVATFVVICPRGHAATGVTLYIAPNGNDAWTGKLDAPNAARTDGPFASLARARDAVRELTTSPDHRETVTVLVRGGKYFLTETLAFRREDSGRRDAPIAYRAYPGEKPVLSGGLRVTGWKPYKGKILQANLPVPIGESARYRQLFLNGQRQVRSRYPDFDAQNPLYGGWSFIEGPGKADGEGSFIYKPGTFQRHWSRPTSGEVVIFEAGGWVNNIIPIKSVDEGQRLVTMQRGVLDPDRAPWFAPTPLKPGDRFRVENLLEELDQPGEWCLDTQHGVLYFWPPAGALKSTDEVVAPVLDTLIDLRNTSWLTISGFTLTETTGGDALHRGGVDGFGPMYPEEGTTYVGDTVHLSGADHCEIEHNLFDAVGGNAIYLEGFNLRNSIRRNEISYAGANGISLLGSYSPVGNISATLLNGKQRMPLFNDVVDNHIHHCGFFNKYVAGVFLGVSDGNLIAHNRIEFLPHHAVNLGLNGFGRNIVEYNDIRQVALEIMDTGAINSWMDFEKSEERAGHIIRFNLIKDVAGCHTTKEGEIIAFDASASGIYLDNNASNSLIYGNIIVRASRSGIYLHGGKNNLIENNIVVDSTRTASPHAVPWPRGQISYGPYTSGAFFTGNQFSHNIVSFTRGPVPVALISIWNGDPEVRPGQARRELSLLFSRAEQNLFFRPDGGTLDIQLGGRFNDERKTETLSLADWQELGFDTSSEVADPRFVDAAHDDFRLEPDSPAFRLGFVPIDTRGIGIRPETERAASSP